MHPFSPIGRFFGLAKSPGVYTRTGRVLLVLASILLIALPFTQRIWTWDRFLHGGHDFETNLLLILCALCLVLVMIRHYRQGFRLLLTFRARMLRPLPRAGSMFPAKVSPWPDRAPARQKLSLSLPLQI